MIVSKCGVKGRGGDVMKITRILPKPLAIYYQEYDLRKADSYLEYYRTMVRVLEERSEEGHTELRRLKEDSTH